MSAPLVALGIVAVIVLGTMLFALASAGRIATDPQQYIVGGRSFGTLFLWLLLAGEVYTSFTFLGAAGWAYGRGAPAYYILAYGTCGYVIGYFLLPAIWRVAEERGLLTAPDFFVDRYGSRALGVGVALTQFVMIVPYVTLQLTGLQILLTMAGYGTFDATAAVGVAFLLMALFVFTAGLRGTAWASVVKDALVLAAVTFAGIAIPMRFFSSVPAMLEHLRAAHPAMLTLAPGAAPSGTFWYVSTVLLTGIGFYMGPQSFAAVYSARSAEALRRNAIFLPLYQIVLLLVFFAGFSALLIVPGLKGAAADQSFLLVVQRFYPPWVMGLIAAAGALAALVPASALLLGAASVIAKNVLGDGLNLVRTDRARLIATRAFVLVIAVLALVFWLVEKQTLVGLLLIVYSGITQFAPGVVCAFLWRRATAWGVGAGLVAGLAAAVWLSVSAIPIAGLNAGFVALMLNVVVLVAVSLATPQREPVALRSGT
ncbi:MAG TPA: sodium:solute symporter family protein [Candidatus Tyrphobacter sp.]